MATDWFHSIDVGDGIVTPGAASAAYLQKVLTFLQLPADMHGMRVLDVGANDGFFSFECEERGAEVVAVDVLPESVLRLELARRLRGSRIRYQQMSVDDLQPDTLGGTFDLVLCPGVYCHLCHPFVALDSLWRGSYEGTQFAQQPDGSWNSTWKAPWTHGLPDRGPTSKDYRSVAAPYPS